HWHNPSIRDDQRVAGDALSRAGRPCREHEIVLADRVDELALVRRLRGDAPTTHRRRDDVAHLLRSTDGRLLRVTDEPFESGLAQRFVALRDGAHRAHELADARDLRRIAADAQLRTARDDLHRELALD